MLRMTDSYSADAAASYHLTGIKQAAYYTGHSPGIWYGRGAQRLGLDGTVTQHDFAALASGYDPVSGAKLVQRIKDDRRAGMDFVFSVPKSVTLLFEHTRNEAILELFRQAVTQTMQDVEAAMQTQDYDRKGNKTRTHTRNLVWTQFMDFESRPTDFAQHGEESESGGPGMAIPDPHLHCHAYAFAPTWNENRRRWQAGEFGRIKGNGAYYEALFLSRMAAGLKTMGYRITPTAGGRWWEITGISRRLVDKFSRRSAEIGETARREGVINEAELDRLGEMTRNRKSTRHSLDDLRTLWRERLTEDDLGELNEAARIIPDDGGNNGGEYKPVCSHMALDFALAKLLERSSAVTRETLFTEALRYGGGDVTRQDLDQSLSFRSRVLTAALDGRIWVTTAEVAAEEEALCRTVREGIGVCEPLAASAPDVCPDEGILLSADQQQAVDHILLSPDAVIAVRGVAGTGKTTLLRAAVEAIETGGKHVLACAPTTSATNVLKQDGFADAVTLQKILASPALQETLEGQIILVDEAGLVSVKQMKALMDIARDKSARVILVGDEHQHGSVERSDVNVLRILHEQAGLAPVEVTEIRRQEDPAYREAVRALSRGDVADGFARLEDMGAIAQIQDHGQRYKALADDYFIALDAGQSVLVVAPSHFEGGMVTQHIRNRLRERGTLTDQQRKVQVLRSQNWTVAERGHAALYLHDHLAVEFTRNANGFARGERVFVSSFDDKGRVLVERSDGRTGILPLHQAERFEVYALEDMAVSVGESIRFTRNGEAIGGSAIVNGETARIAGFTPEGDMSLQDGRSVGGDYGHIAYGYVATSHKAQGSTVDTVLIAENPANGAASPEQLYVSASRARKSVRIYTPSRHNLLQAVSRKNPGVCAATVAQTARNDIEEEEEHRTNYEARIRNDEAHRAWQARMKLYETWPPGALRKSWNVATRLHALWDKAVVVMATFLGFSPEGGT